MATSWPARYELNVKASYSALGAGADLGGGSLGAHDPPLKSLRKNWGVHAQYSLHIVDAGIHVRYSRLFAIVAVSPRIQ